MVMLRLLKKLDPRAEAVLINATPDEDLSSNRIPTVKVKSHTGLVRTSCVRVRGQFASDFLVLVLNVA
jgi:hypothetical protein